MAPNREPSVSSSGSGSGSGSESESEAESPKSQEIPKTPAVPQPSSSSESGSGSGSGSESGSDSDTDTDTKKADTAVVKPIASKPMVSGTKRPLEKDQNEPKKVQITENSNGVKKPKPTFQRIWSEDDEIAILKGLIEYQSEKGLLPSGDMSDFHNFVKKSLHVDMAKSQVADKVRRLKKKYETGARKKNFTPKGHELEMFDLMKRLWGSGNSNAKQKGSAIKAVPKASPKAAPKVEKVDENNDEVLVPVNTPGYEVTIGMSTFEENVINSGLELLPEAKRKALDEKKRDLDMMTAELYLKRVDFVREKAKLVVDAMKATRK